LVSILVIMASAQGLFEELLLDDLHPSSILLRENMVSIPQLAVSIAEKGLTQPIVVRSKGDNSYFEIIAGNRRFEACKMLGWSKVICHIMEVDDDKEAYEVSLIENLQQKSMNPIEEAKAFKKYVETFGWGGESDLSRRIGKSQEYISRRIRLLSLPKEMQNEIIRQRISVGLAQELFGLDDFEFAQDLYKSIVEDRKNKNNDNLNTREVRQIVKAARDKPEKFREIIMNNSYISVGDFYGNISSNSSVNSKDNNTKCDILKFSKSMNVVYKKCILALRISLKSIDIQLEELENNYYHHYGNDDDGGDPCYRWIVREIIMQHRLRLHDQLGILLNQQHKFIKVLGT
jgi:ParB family transcriptional regulator, chromosome partitioning protein